MTSVGRTTDTAGRTGPLDLYRALWAEREDLVRRYHLDFVAIAGLIVVWIAIRTLYGDTGRAYLAWVLASAALILVSPRAGLLLYIVTGALFDNVQFSRALALQDLLVPVLAVSVGARIVLDRGRTVPRSFALLLGVLLAIGTLLGVAHSVFVAEDPDWAWHAAYTWVATIGGAMVILVAAAWVARKGDLAPLITAVVVAVAVALIALAEYIVPGVVSGGPFSWVGFWKSFPGRLAGIIPSPNGVAAQLVGPAALLLVAVGFARNLRLRVFAGVALVPLALALYLTYSRSPLVALVALGVIAAWRIRRVFGLVALGLVLAASLLIVPSYMALRGQALGDPSGQALIASDQWRIQAWGAAAAMWQASPLIGHGFLSYKLLGDAYGDPVLGSPHNEWLRLFAEEGLIVGTLGLLFIGVGLWDLGRLPGWRGTAFMGAFASIVLAASFNNPFLFLQVSAISYTIVGTGLALAARSRRFAPMAEATEYPRRTL